MTQNLCDNICTLDLYILEDIRFKTCASRNIKFYLIDVIESDKAEAKFLYHEIIKSKILKCSQYGSKI